MAYFPIAATLLSDLSAIVANPAPHPHSHIRTRLPLLLVFAFV